MAETLVASFTPEFQRQSPDEFVAAYLLGTGVEAVAVGEDFRFGRQRAGDRETLAQAGLTVLDVEEIEGVSSTDIRDAVREADLAGAAAMLGHARPVFLGFSKGGKMVATAGGVALALAPLAALGCAAIWILAFALTRYASLASMLAAAALPVLCLAFGASWPVVAFTAIAAVGVLALHRQNVRRLLSGTEPRFARGAPSRS